MNDKTDINPSEKSKTIRLENVNKLKQNLEYYKNVKEMKSFLNPQQQSKIKAYFDGRQKSLLEQRKKVTQETEWMKQMIQLMQKSCARDVKALYKMSERLANEMQSGLEGPGEPGDEYEEKQKLIQIVEEVTNEMSTLLHEIRMEKSEASAGGRWSEEELSEMRYKFQSIESLVCKLKTNQLPEAIAIEGIVDKFVIEELKSEYANEIHEICHERDDTILSMKQRYENTIVEKEKSLEQMKKLNSDFKGQVLELQNKIKVIQEELIEKEKSITQLQEELKNNEPPPIDNSESEEETVNALDDFLSQIDEMGKEAETSLNTSNEFFEATQETIESLPIPLTPGNLKKALQEFNKKQEAFDEQVNEVVRDLTKQASSLRDHWDLLDKAKNSFRIERQNFQNFRNHTIRTLEEKDKLLQKQKQNLNRDISYWKNAMRNDRIHQLKEKGIVTDEQGIHYVPFSALPKSELEDKVSTALTEEIEKIEQACDDLRVAETQFQTQKSNQLKILDSKEEQLLQEEQKLYEQQETFQFAMNQYREESSDFHNKETILRNLIRKYMEYRSPKKKDLPLEMEFELFTKTIQHRYEQIHSREVYMKRKEAELQKREALVKDREKAIQQSLEKEIYQRIAEKKLQRPYTAR